MKKIICAALVTTFACAAVLAADAPKGDAAATAPAPSAEQAAMMKKFQEYSMPGEAHKRLTDLAGNYTYTSKMWEKEGAKPMESKGTSTFKAILGGRWLQQEFKGEAMGMPFEGIGMMGYDNLQKKYETVWFDSMGTGVVRGTGDFDTKKKTLTDTGTHSCPLAESKTREFKGEFKVVNKDNLVYTMYSTFPGGTKMAKQMEIAYKRVK